jgi:hypothetical protein
MNTPDPTRPRSRETAPAYRAPKLKRIGSIADVTRATGSGCVIGCSGGNPEPNLHEVLSPPAKGRVGW